MEARTSATRAFRLALHVGAEGAAFDTPLPFEPGTPVELVFALPDGTGPVVVKGRAELLGKAAEGDGEYGCMAVAYPQASLEAKRVLDAYVRERLGLDPT